MSSNPLVRPDFWAGAPNETDYDAVCAAVTATERGRWFLAEFANRNRNANTDLVTAAIARVEAAIRGDRLPPSAIAWRDLTGLAATIGRITEVIGTGKGAAQEIAAVAERVADIAFDLRKRGIDAQLCDALDATVRDLAAICANQKTNGQETRNASELWREVAGRVDDLIQQSITVQTRDSNESAVDIRADALPIASSDAGDEEDANGGDYLSRGSLFDMEPEESKRFADAVAALASSLPPPADAPLAAVEDECQFEPIRAPQDEGSTVRLNPIGAGDESPRWHIEAPDFVFDSPSPPANNDEVQSSQALLSDAHPLLPEAQLQLGPRDDPADLFVTPGQTDDVLPPQANSSPVLPQDWPAMGASPAGVTPDQVVAPQEGIAPRGEIPPPQLRPANGPVVRAIPSPAPADPLDDLRTLSKDELIALFG
jgi:hypothetical protein